MESHGFTPMKQVSNEISSTGKEVSINKLPFKDIHLLLIIFMLILVEKFFRRNNYSLSLDINNFIRSPETKEILSAVIPYLDDYEQQNVYTLLGLLEAVDTIYGVADGTYQDIKIATTPVPFRSESERIIGILNAVKPYIAEPSQELVDTIVKAQTMSSKLARNMRVYKSKRLSGESPLENLDTFYEILDILRPIIPEEKLEPIDRITTMAKLFEASPLKEQIFSKDSKPELEKSDEAPASKNDNSLETIAKVINLFSQMAGDNA